MRSLAAILPITRWIFKYNKTIFASDLLAALIVTIMLIPQSLAYALLAGLPPEVGLYATILPLILYAIFGTSSTLSVGPVAVASLMTAVALGEVVEQGTADYLSGAILLAALSGGFLILMGFLRLGFLANFLSHPVISGFISASAIIIALSQSKHLLGIKASGDNVIEISGNLIHHIGQFNIPTFVLGMAALVFLFSMRSYGVGLLMALGLSKATAAMVNRAAPIVAILGTITVTMTADLSAQGVAIVGTIPAGLPSISIPVFSSDLLHQLILPAILISVIGYVESVSVGKTLGAARREKIDVNQEFIGLGAANIASSVSGGFPVTGGFSRSVVNFDSGAQTQAAGVFTAIGIAIASVSLTPFLYYLPKATLAATIIVAVITLIDLKVLKKTWAYSSSDFAAVFITLAATLLLGVEAGVLCGVTVSLALHLYRTSRPHIAEVGLVEGSHHFRNVRRYHVETVPEILSLRVDESLFFANAHFLEDYITTFLYENDSVAHVILMCSAVNEVDYSAYETLVDLNRYLCDQGVMLHLSEVKGPVMDVLQRGGLASSLSGEIYLSQYDAYFSLRESIR